METLTSIMERTTCQSIDTPFTFHGMEYIIERQEDGKLLLKKTKNNEILAVIEDI